MNEVDPTIPLVTEPSNIIGLMGPPGVGKTTLIQQATKYWWDEHGLKSRVIGADAGSYNPYRQGIEKGYISYLSADAWDKVPANVLYQRLMEGHWPEDPQTPNSVLRPGFETLRICPFCSKDSGARGAAYITKCGTCGKDLPPGRALAVQRKLTSLAGTGLLAMEGMTKVGATLLNASRKARPGDKFYVAGDDPEGQKIAAKANDGLKKGVNDRTKEENEAIKVASNLETLGELSLASSAEMGHYMKADQDLVDIIHAAKRVPVPMVIMTFHEGAWEEKIDKTKTISNMELRGLGPVTPVMKRMKLIPGWFSIFGRVVINDNNTRELIMEEHFGKESTRVKWVGKTNIIGAPKRLTLGDPTKVNSFKILMAEIKKAQERELP